jgi:hypothetical protein
LEYFEFKGGMKNWCNRFLFSLAPVLTYLLFARRLHEVTNFTITGR